MTMFPLSRAGFEGGGHHPAPWAELCRPSLSMAEWRGGEDEVLAMMSAQDGAAKPDDLDSFNLIEPPPLDWRSDSSSDDASPGDDENLELLSADDVMRGFRHQGGLSSSLSEAQGAGDGTGQEAEEDTEIESEERGQNDVDHSHIQNLLSQLQSLNSTPAQEQMPEDPPEDAAVHPPAPERSTTSGLLFSESHQRDLLGFLEEPPVSCRTAKCLPCCFHMNHWGFRSQVFSCLLNSSSALSVPGPCDPEDLLDGVIFGAKYLGSTQLQTEKNPSTNARMAQAQEAVDRIKAPDGESQPMTEVDLFISTQRIKVLSADTQEAMMDHSLQMISYIADIGNILVLMARRKRKAPDSGQAGKPQKKSWMICHVFTSEDAQLIAQAIGQAFAVAYQQFLQVNGIKSSDLKPGEYCDFLGAQELYNGDLAHFSCSENLREVCICKEAGEILGVAVVESGWGSILPTVVVANLLHGGPAERSGQLSIGDRVMSVNGTSLVGLPIDACHSIIRELKNQTRVKLSIVHCPPVTMAIIKRPEPRYQLGFSVEDGIICSLMRGGIAERGGIRVGHRIIEINGQSVVATAHEKIIHILTHAVGEIHLKTMPASTYRLLTGQEQPVFL
uniref:Amyloid-beta A4 precursor protein-binding family A member 3 n=1 Tax=Denticeps clupeoides TaxID=299321 RepID=A0AAY4CH26_9TELE